MTIPRVSHVYRCTKRIQTTQLFLIIVQYVRTSSTILPTIVNISKP